MFEVSRGPRLLPGTYSVKMTKGDQVYTEPLNVVLDPRAKFSLEDRKAQFDLATKLYKLLGHMTYSVAAIEGVRNAANDRIAKLADKDPVRKQLQQLAEECEKLRSRIVATKEGGMITGEERIREHVGQLYGAVNGYEGRPGAYQVARAESLERELGDVNGDGRPDVAVANYNNSPYTANVLLNSGDGSFTSNGPAAIGLQAPSS